MIVEHAQLPDFLTNTYVVGEPGGTAFFVDAGGPVAPLIEIVDREGMTPTHVLLTHHHYDHVLALPELLERWPDLEVLIHPAERDLVDAATGDLVPGETLHDRRHDDRAAAHAGPHRRHGRARRRRPGLHRRHALQGLGRRRARPREHELRGPQGVDHGDAREAPAGDDRAARPLRSRRRSATSSRTTRSSASGAASTPRATSRARRSASPRRSSCSATTTTAGTRRGSAGPTGVTTSSPARRSSARADRRVRVTPARGGPARRGRPGRGR